MKLASLKRLSLPKSWIVLGSAVGIGLLASLVAYSYLSGQIAEIEARGRTETVPVVVAKFNLVKGTRLSSENVAIRAIPKDYAHSGAVSPEQFDRLDGEPLAHSVDGGEMILWGLMESKKAPTFSSRVDAGRRAITVPVDEINSISGLLEPGDVIDLIVSTERKSKKMVLPLLQRVRVLATGQRSEDDPKTGERRSYSTVTLDTTPEDAQKVIVAREAGRITALLRNPQDLQPIPNAGGDLAALLGLGAERGVIEPDQIPVLYGGRNARFSPEALTLQPPAVASAKQEALSEVGRRPTRHDSEKEAAAELSRQFQK